MNSMEYIPDLWRLCEFCWSVLCWFSPPDQTECFFFLSLMWSCFVIIIRLVVYLKADQGLHVWNLWNMRFCGSTSWIWTMYKEKLIFLRSVFAFKQILYGLNSIVYPQTMYSKAVRKLFLPTHAQTASSANLHFYQWRKERILPGGQAVRKNRPGARNFMFCFCFLILCLSPVPTGIFHLCQH